MANGTAKITTDTDTGTVHYVLTLSATAPSAPQIMAQTDHADVAAPAFGSMVVTADGEQSDPVAGLAEATEYFTYFVQDNLGILSDVFSAPGVTT